MLTFLLEGGNRFSFRFGASVDRIGVDVLGDDVADGVAVAVDRLGVLNVFGNGGLSFFCLLASSVWGSTQKILLFCDTRRDSDDGR